MSAPRAGRPPAVDLSGELLPVLSQGPRGTCLAFSVTAAHEHARAADEGVEDLSEEMLFWAAKEIDGDREEGTSFESAAQALRETGQPREEHWPYDGTRDIRAASYSPPAAAVEPGNLKRARLRSIPPTLDAIREELAEGRVVAIGIELWDGFALPVNGDLETPDPAELNGEGHAMVVVGYDDQQQTLLLRNSWGQRWGQDGHATAGFDFVPQHLIAAWVVGEIVALAARRAPTIFSAAQSTAGSNGCGR